MREIIMHRVVKGLIVLCVLTGVNVHPDSHAEEWKWEGQAPEGKWTGGFRAGFSLLTQELTAGTSTDVGPTVNLMALYGLNKWINVGMMLDWERRSVDLENPKADFGTLNTVSLLPTVELRPGHYGKLAPYVSTGIGVNVNSFSESRGIPTTSFSNTFAFRLAGGADYALTSKLALNTELAWKRNRGGIESLGARDNFDASSFNLLVGVRYIF